MMKRTFLPITMMMFIFAAANAQDSTQNREFVGKYKFPDGSVVPEVEVVIENGMLMMNSSAGTSSLELIKGDTFTIVAFNGTAAFKRNDVKKVVGVHIDAGGYILDGVKDSVASIIHVAFRTAGPFPGLAAVRTAGESSFVSNVLPVDLLEQRKRTSIASRAE
jgi:hypothetical protein